MTTSRTLRATVEWLLEVDPQVRVKAIGFRAHATRAPARNWPEPGPGQLEGYRRLLTELGVRSLEVV